MLEALGRWPGALWLQESGTAYLFVNASHILGIALLLGAILPLDLRLLGAFRRFPLEVLGPFLLRAAATGLALAAISGAWLFSVNPLDYVGNSAFRWKAALLLLALGNVALQHRVTDTREWAVTPVTRVAAAMSLILWPGVLIAGRWIGFV